MTTTAKTLTLTPAAAGQLAAAQAALAAIGLTIWQAGALACAADVAEAAADPEQWAPGTSFEEIAEAWCEDAWDVRQGELRDAAQYLTA